MIVRCPSQLGVELTLNVNENDWSQPSSAHRSDFYQLHITICSIFYPIQKLLLRDSRYIHVYLFILEATRTYKEIQRLGYGRELLRTRTYVDWTRRLKQFAPFAPSLRRTRRGYCCQMVSCFLHVRGEKRDRVLRQEQVWLIHHIPNV